MFVCNEDIFLQLCAAQILSLLLEQQNVMWYVQCEKKMQVDVLPAYFLLALTCKIHSKSTAHRVSFLEFSVWFLTLKINDLPRHCLGFIFVSWRGTSRSVLVLGMFCQLNSQLLRQLVMAILDQGIKPGLCWSQYKLYQG